MGGWSFTFAHFFDKARAERELRPPANFSFTLRSMPKYRPFSIGLISVNFLLSCAKIFSSLPRQAGSAALPCVLAIILPLCSRGAQAASTRRMAERLKKIADEADPLQNRFLNHRAAEIFRQQLEQILQRTGENA